jgi:AcrR family transcriptional regulator
MHVNDNPGSAGVTTRRARMRAATLSEIKQHAWAQVAEGGALSISLRGIARQMGMTSSALYRYFDSQEQLISELVADGYESLAEALEAAESAVGERPERIDAGEHFMCLARAYRTWALEHASEYSLVFGSPLCLPHDDARIKGQHWRGINVLFRSMIQGILAGDLDPSRLPPPSTALRKQFKAWQKEMASPLSPEALAGCMVIWSLLHGAISLELFDQIPPFLRPADDLFEQQMRAALVLLGCPLSMSAAPARP